MRMIKRLVSANFWYDAALKATIASTLRTLGHFDEERIKQLLARHRQLYRANHDLVKDVQSEYHVSWSSMISAIYESLRASGLPEPEALERTADLLFKNMGSDSVAQYIKAALDRSKDRFAYIVASSKRQELRFFGNTFDFYRPVDSERSYHLRVRRCVYNAFFQRNGLPELMAIACKWDLISWSKGIDSERHGITFCRPKTLGIDGVDCEFDFEKVG